MKTKHLLLTPALLFAASSLQATILLPINEEFIGLQEGNINGQQTSPTPSDYFTGGEAWDAVETAFSARGYRGSTSGLSYLGIGPAGGSVEAFRDTDFRSTSLGTRASLTPNNQPASLAYPETGSLYFSFLVNFDGYTARSNDGEWHGVLVDFDHEIEGGRKLGVHIGGATGGDNDNLRLSLLTESGSTDSDFVDTGFTLAPGTNLVQLRIIHSSATPDGVAARYEFWLNPTTLEDLNGDPDFVHDEDFGLARNNSDFGFDSFGISQSFNDEQSVFIDQLYLGEVAIPEPSVYAALLGLGALGLVLLRRRRR